MTLDLSTSLGVLNYAERQRQEMRAVFDRLGRYEHRLMAFHATAFATHDIEPAPGPFPFRTGPRLPAVKAVPVALPAVARVLLPPEQHTEAFAHITKKFCEMVRAVGTLLMSEMWLAHSGPLDASLSREEQRKAFEEERAARPASLEDWDDRQESLYMTLEHVAVGRKVWFATITRNPTIVHPWVEREILDMEGRFVGLTEVRS